MHTGPGHNTNVFLEKIKKIPTLLDIRNFNNTQTIIKVGQSDTGTPKTVSHDIFEIYSKKTQNNQNIIS